MTALVPWLPAPFESLGGAFVVIVLLLISTYLAWDAFWLIATVAIAIPLRRSQRARSLVGRLFGTPTTNEEQYTCQCGAPMANTTAHSTDEYTIRTWHCTDEACLRVGQEYRFANEAHNYGTGPLDGQVKP